MNTIEFTKRTWQDLLDIGSFSIGPFVITAHNNNVRVFHTSTNHVCQYSRKTFFYEMRQLCHERGYTLHCLFKRFNPKSHQRFTGKSHQDDTTLTDGEKIVTFQ